MRIIEAPDPDPESIYGIWENSHAHQANITVSNNRFVNLSPDNDPALNSQRAFRLASHSSATSTVTYANNEAIGANVGFKWLEGFGGQDFSAHDPIQVIGNTFLDNATGVRIRSQGSAVLRCNRFTGNSIAISNDGLLADADAAENWFGCNAGPGGGDCDPNDGAVDAPAWLVLAATAADATLKPGEATTVTADLTRNSGGDPAGCKIPDGVPVSFEAIDGSVMPTESATVGGTAPTTLTVNGSALAAALATIDRETQAVFIFVDATETDLRVTKSDGISIIDPGSVLDYVIEVTNDGPSNVAGASFEDLLPSPLTACSWTCSSTSGGVCTASGAGDIVDAIDLPVGGSLRYELTCTFQPVPDFAPALNTVTVTLPAGMTDLDPADNSATDATQSTLAIIFADGFESGNTSAWSSSVEGP